MAQNNAIAIYFAQNNAIAIYFAQNFKRFCPIFCLLGILDL